VALVRGQAEITSYNPHQMGLHITVRGATLLKQ